MSQTSGRRTTGMTLLMVAGSMCLMMFVFLAMTLLSPDNERASFSFWLFTGLTIFFSLAGGRFLRRR
ncbi:MAG TPA: hypothetical protein VF885_13090 [Arthrobacter sp.]